MQPWPGLVIEGFKFDSESWKVTTEVHVNKVFNL